MQTLLSLACAGTIFTATAHAAGAEAHLDDDGTGLALGLHLPRLRLEMRGDAGENTALLDPGHLYYRAQPTLVLDGAPGPTSWFLASGIGAAIVTSDLADTADTTTLTTLAMLGARMRTPIAPAITMLQIDGVANHGSAVMLKLALETR